MNDNGESKHDGNRGSTKLGSISFGDSAKLLFEMGLHYYVRFLDMVLPSFCGELLLSVLIDFTTVHAPE